MRPCLGLAALVLALPACALRVAPSPRVVALGPATERYVPIADGPPRSVAMQSGAVSLAPHETVGAHDTGDDEEIVVPLEGRGELRIAGRAPIALAPGVVAYTPPHTRHDVANVGDRVFRYVYVASPAR